MNSYAKKRDSNIVPSVLMMSESIQDVGDVAGWELVDNPQFLIRQRRNSGKVMENGSGGMSNTSCNQY